MDGEIELVKTEEERDGWVFLLAEQPGSERGRQAEGSRNPSCSSPT